MRLVAGRLGVLAALLAVGSLLAVACGGSASDTQTADRVGASQGIPTGPAVTMAAGYASPEDHVPSTGAWVPDNGQPTLVFVDAIW